VDRGYIKTWRKSLNWCWYKYPMTAHLFGYLLIKATYKPIRIGHVDLLPGQLIFGSHQCCFETGLSRQSVRTSLERLKSTSEITIKSTNRFSIITILNYSTYQSQEDSINQQINQPPNKPTTIKQPANNHIQEVKKERSNNILGKPDSLEAVVAFMSDKDMGANFWDYYQSNGWKVGGKTPMRDWQAAARRWMRNNSGGSNEPRKVRLSL